MTPLHHRTQSPNASLSQTTSQNIMKLWLSPNTAIWVLYEIDQITRQAMMNTEGIDESHKTVVAYADDVTLMGPISLI